MENILMKSFFQLYLVQFTHEILLKIYTLLIFYLIILLLKLKKRIDYECKSFVEKKSLFLFVLNCNKRVPIVSLGN